MNRNIPRLRFSGFTDAWELRKLGDITKKIGSGKTPKGGNATYLTEGIPLIRSQNIFNETFNHADVAYISIDTDEEMKNSRVYKDDVLLNITGASIGRSAVYRQNMNANVNQHVCIIRLKEDYSSDFVQLNLSSNKGQKEIDLNQAGGGREGLNFQQISKIEFSYPSTEEQKVIGKLFDSLDSTIALHQRKLELLKTQKKGFLQKMFPKNGSNVPKIRFKGFSDAWKQIKLKDLGNTFTGLSGKTKEDFGHGQAKFVTYVNVYTHTISDLSLTENVEIDEKQNQVKYGDIFFTTSSETPEEVGMSSVWLGNDNNVYLNSFCFGYRPNVELEPYYAAFMLRSSEVRKKFMLLAQGISRYNISKTKAMEMFVPFPTFEEQKKIGAFFKQLDDSIALQERKLEALKEQKKGFLQKMFV